MANTKIIAISAIVVVAVVAVAGYFLLTGSDDDSDKFVLVYDANGGTGSMSKSKCDPGAGSSLIVSDCNYTNDDNFRRFASWNTKSDGTGITVDPGFTFKNVEAGKTTLYAQWKAYDMFECGIGTTNTYSIGGGYSYSYWNYTLGGTLTDKIIADGATEQTFERTQNLIVSWYENGNQSQTTNNTITKTQSKDVKYTGTPMTLSTKWGMKNVICVKSTEVDNGNTISLTEYRDAESYLRYKSVLSCDNYVVSGSTLKNYEMTLTLTDYDWNYGGTA